MSISDTTITNTINAIKCSYGDKYSDRDYTRFKEYATKAKNTKQLITLVENLFDIDYSDARDMVL